MTAATKEKVLWRGRPALAAFWGFYVVAALTLALSLAVDVFLTFPPWAWGIVLLFFSAMITGPFLFQRAWRFTVTDLAVRSEFDFITRLRMEAPLRSVTDITVRQGVIDRLLGIGEVRFSTAGTTFPGVVFWGLEDPVRVADRLRREVL